MWLLNIILSELHQEFKVGNMSLFIFVDNLIQPLNKLEHLFLFHQQLMWLSHTLEALSKRLAL